MSLYSNINVLEQIRNMYPKWYLDIYEMREIIQIEALLAENLQKAIELILDNHFIDTIDENKASELERYLGITGTSNRPIDERRKIIKTYFLGRGKLSMSQIIAIVEALTNGVCRGSFSIGDAYSNNTIKLSITDCDVKNMLIDVIDTLKQRVPAHLWVDISYRPKSITVKRKHGAYSHTSINYVASFYDEHQIELSVPVFAHIYARQSYSTNVSAEINLICGGDLQSEFETVICGGTLSQSDFEDTINGNY